MSDRRDQQKREDDQLTIRQVSSMTRRLRRLVVAALIAWAFVASIACMALVIELLRSNRITENARRAATQATTALVFATGNSQRIQAEAIGECRRVNYLRWHIDRELYSSWRRDRTSAHFLSNGISPSVKDLGRYLARTTATEVLLPLTDCHAATSRPLHYKPPEAIPFERISPRTLARLLAHPPRSH